MSVPLGKGTTVSMNWEKPEIVALAGAQIEFEFLGPSIRNSEEVGPHADLRPSWPHKRSNPFATLKRAEKRLAGICAKIDCPTHPISGRPIYRDVGGVFGAKVRILSHLFGRRTTGRRRREKGQRSEARILPT